MLRSCVVALVFLACLAAHAQVSRDAVSVNILSLLSKARSTATVSGQVHHLGDPDGQTDAITFSVDVGSAAALADETKSDGTHVRSTVFQGQRTYADGRPADNVNSAYILFPQFDLADELANPAVAIDAGQTSPGQVSIRLHTVPTSGLDLPNEIDKTYIVDTTFHQVVAVKSMIKVGTSRYLHEFRYGNYQSLLAGFQTPTTISEYLYGEQLSQLTVTAIQ